MPASAFGTEPHYVALGHLHRRQTLPARLPCRLLRLPDLRRLRRTGQHPSPAGDQDPIGRLWSQLPESRRGSGKKVFADGTVPTTLRLTEPVTYTNGTLHLAYETVGAPTYGNLAIRVQDLDRGPGPRRPNCRSTLRPPVPNPGSIRAGFGREATRRAGVRITLCDCDWSAARVRDPPVIPRPGVSGDGTDKDDLQRLQVAGTVACRPAVSLGFPRGRIASPHQPGF